MRAPAIALISAVTLSVTVGCARPSAEMRLVTCPGLCSEGSTYSPTMRLFVTTTAGATSITVSLDSGTVRVPGSPPVSADGPSLMEHLFLRAFVAVDLSAHEAHTVREHAWRALAWSDSIPLADVLRYGELRSVPPQIFHVPLNNGQTLPGAWLGFAITGDAVNLRASTPAQRLMRGGVRVFACDPRQLLGVSDMTRVARLRDTYSAAC